MTIMETDGKPEEAPAKEASEKQDNPEAEAEKAEADAVKEEKGMFSDENIMKDTEVKLESPKPKDVVITPEDKVAFIDSMVANSRFTKRYSLFGGKVKFTLRSLTSDEVNALAEWTVKQGTTDTAAMMSGRYRKYLAAAHVAEFNGVEMPPLDEPLFERLASDGKTVEQPGWIGRTGFWDGMAFGLFASVMARIEEFDTLYSTLCMKASDENFWSPDTP